MEIKKKCFIIQPYDNGKFDKRYYDIIKPTIEDLGIISYRVDNDISASIPIESMEQNIKESDICLADISTDNPNVWYEVGFAFSAGKPVILICSETDRAGVLPFDIRHRMVIYYKTESSTDFDALKNTLKKRFLSVLENLNLTESSELEKSQKDEKIQIIEQRNFIRPLFADKLNKAVKRIWVLGTTLNGFREDQMTLVRKKLREGLEIRLLALHPRKEEVKLSNRSGHFSMVEWRDFESNSGDKHKFESHKLEKWVYEENNKMVSEGISNRIELRYYISFPIGAIMIIDDILFYSPSLTFSQNMQNSTLVLEKNQSSFDKFEEHFSDIWSNNKICFNSTEDQIFLDDTSKSLDDIFKRKKYYKELDYYTSNEIDLSEHAKDKIYYNELSPFFSLAADKNNEKQIDFISNIDQYSSRTIQKILDLGCGVGRLSAPLSKKGFIITGIDISEKELELAKKNDIVSNYESGDIRNWQSKLKHDLAICMWSTLNYLSTEKSITEFFKCQYNNLVDEGLLLIDLKNPQTIPEKEIKKKLFSFPYEMELSIKKSKTNNYLEGIYNHKITNVINHDTITISDQELYRIYFEKDILNLSLGNFELLEVFGDYDITNRYNEELSDRLILLLKKIKS